MEQMLIRANIAMMQNDPAEVARLLKLYREGNHHIADEPLLLWLEANSQSDPQIIHDVLQELVKQVPPNHIYHQMAMDYLSQEEDYGLRIAIAEQASRSIPGVTTGRVIATLILLALFAVGVVFLSTLMRPQTTTVALEPSPTPFITPTSRIDTSIELDINTYSVRFAEGLIQIARLEDESERVVDARSLEILTPIEGARFFAVYLFFECRIGVCDNPPEADLSLLLDNELVVPMRENVALIEGERLQPIALGRRTRGWVVFEVPTIAEPSQLLIVPRSGGIAETVTIALPEN